MTTALMLFRRDLRLADNPALSKACAAHQQVLPVFIDETPAKKPSWQEGAASRWWLHHSLAALDTQLQRHHARLHIARGDTLKVLQQLIGQSGAQAVYWNRLYEPEAIARDTRIKKSLREQGIEVHSTNASLWCEPWQIATQQGEPYHVFTPFWRNLRARLAPPDRLWEEPVLHGWKALPNSLPLSALNLLPGIAWDSGMGEAWQPGERGAREWLEIFIDDALGDYAHARDLPARHGTSRLSPHLHFGEISPRQIHAELHRRQASNPKCQPDIEPYLRELGWREFAHHLLYHFPATPEASFNSRFDRFDWASADQVLLQRWQQGRTGIPLVDAGMRELWHTGWMHNRVRMVVASFLTKNLRQHWLRGARWFWDTLVDADLANNTLGWQWVAGCGADAAPYFRVFNPLTQARKFDPQVQYLKKWLPELAGLSAPQLHDPLKHAQAIQGTGYPAPMVDLGQSRQDALNAFEALRQQA